VSVERKTKSSITDMKLHPKKQKKMSKEVKLLVQRIAQMLAISEEEVVRTHGTGEKKLTKLCIELTKNVVVSKDANDMFSEKDDYEPEADALKNVPTVTEVDKSKADDIMETKIKPVMSKMIQGSSDSELGDHRIDTSGTALGPIQGLNLG
jgi:hypothetical protein